MSQRLNQSLSQRQEGVAAMRRAVVDEAHSWLRTPWHHEGRVKGAGVDCAQFLIGVFVNVGLVEDFQTDHYPADWHLNNDEKRFLAYLLQYADPVAEPMPGDVAMFRYARHEAHGSIVVDAAGPTIIHAWRDEGMVTLTDLSTNPLSKRLAGFYRLKGLS